MGMWGRLGPSLALFVLGLVACSSFSGADDTPSNDGGSADNDASADGPPVVVGAPEGCDASAEPQTSLDCVVDAYGIFVDPSKGDDTAAGTKAAPVKSITTAQTKLAGRPRIYVCDGDLPEHVKLTIATSIYGGWDCAAWAYNAKRPRVAPADSGAALSIQGVGDPMVVADMDFTSAAGTPQAPSSIGATIVSSQNVTFRRITLTAQNGADGANGTVGAAGTVVSSVTAPADRRTGQTCICSSGENSAGGTGGNFPPIATDGSPAYLVPSPVGADGAHATRAALRADDGSDGPTGMDGLGADHLLDLSADLAPPSPASGQDGAPGHVGQGGGGAGGGANGLGDNCMYETGGGYGGCAGLGGKAGGGGGASIALLLLQSTLQLSQVSLNAASAGRGGNGAAGGPGLAGTAAVDLGALGSSDCGLAGTGGHGGAGGFGGGGAGGVTAGVVFHGSTPPNVEQVTIATGAPGGAGPGGPLGTNDGVVGMKADVYTIP